MTDKEITGLIAALLAVVSNGIYVLSVWRNQTKPHVFSWTIWGLLTGITFFAQRSADAGPGAWHMIVNSAVCFLVAALALLRGGLDIRGSDVITFALALAIIPLWSFSQQPLLAVILVIGIEAFAYYPTFRKSYARPHQELAKTYMLDGLRCLISCAAMDSYSLTTLLYPVFIVIINTALVVMLLQRRNRLAVSPAQ
jgi:hypothetical protein